MTPKERVLAALEGQPVDRFPTGGLYHHLYVELAFSELTDEPPWRVYALPYLEPDAYMTLYREIVERAPFDILEPMGGNQPRQVRQRLEFVEKDGRPYRHDKQTDEWFPLDEPTKSGHVHDVVVSEAQRVFTRQDIDEEFKIVRAEDICPDGQLDPLEAAIAEFGDDHFVLRDGPGGALAWCSAYFGMTNTMMMLIEQPLVATGMQDKVDIKATIKGGGLTGQAGAVRHGISRALCMMDPELRPVLKKGGFMTRDARCKESKKYGQPGARKRYQYSKR